MVKSDNMSEWEEDVTNNFNDGVFDNKSFETPLECGKIIVEFFNRTTRPGNSLRTLVGVKTWRGEEEIIRL